MQFRSMSVCTVFAQPGLCLDMGLPISNRDVRPSANAGSGDNDDLSSGSLQGMLRQGGSQ
jgi:hypothetical protein